MFKENSCTFLVQFVSKDYLVSQDWGKRRESTKDREGGNRSDGMGNQSVVQEKLEGGAEQAVVVKLKSTIEEVNS